MSRNRSWRRSATTRGCWSTKRIEPTKFELNVKQGVGGIRDVEFAVQLLQLVAGGANPSLRTGNTTQALDALTQLGLIKEEERSVLGPSYLFLRNVEHRLQLMDERPVRCLPLEYPTEMDKFGRRLGYKDGTAFLADYRGHTSRVNALFTQLFYGLSVAAPDTEVADWVLTADDPGSHMALFEHLAHLGFADPEGAYQIVKRSEVGGDYGDIQPQARERFAAIAERLLAAAAKTTDPDQGLKGFELLTYAVPSRASLHASLADSPRLLERLVKLAAESPPLWQIVLQHLELLDLLGDDAGMETVSHISADEDIARAAGAFLRRERLRIGARDVWGLDDPAQTMAALSSAAREALGLVLAHYAPQSLAVIGLGKLGGSELNYSSDWDVLWVAADGADLDAATHAAEMTMALLREQLHVDIDARLRPEGRFGRVVREASDYVRYYTHDADTWEKQALIKARYLAGDEAAARVFLTGLVTRFTATR